MRNAESPVSADGGRNWKERPVLVMGGATPYDVPVVRIRPSRGWVSLQLREVWEYRELLYFLAWRTVRVRYQQTVLGAAWAIAQPLFTMAVFTLVFHRFARVSSESLPYPLFAYCGLLPWQLFAQSLAESSNSLINNEHIITKVYFPRLLIPCSTLLTSLLDFVVAGVVLGILMLCYRVAPSPHVWLLPFFVVLVMGVALGTGLWVSALSVRYRDIRIAIPLVTQLLLLFTPVGYPSSLAPASLRPFLGLNPMAGVVEGFRWTVLGSQPVSPTLIVVSAIAAAGLLTSGAVYFRRTERTLADVL